MSVLEVAASGVPFDWSTGVAMSGAVLCLASSVFLRVTVALLYNISNLNTIKYKIHLF